MVSGSRLLKNLPGIMNTKNTISFFQDLEIFFDRDRRV